MLRRAGHLIARALPARRGTAAILVAGAMLCTASPALAGAGEIRVGLAAPMSGRMAAVGRAMQRALEAAVADANRAGGVRGQRLVLDVADDGCAAAVAEGAAGTLVALKPALVIGHPCSGAATAAVRLYTAAGVLMIAVGARHPDVTAARPSALVLRLAGRDDRQGAAAARWLIAHAPGRRVAILHDPTAYARTLADATRRALAAAGVEPVAVLPIATRGRDYRGAVQRLAAADAEAVLIAGYPEEAAIVIAGLNAEGVAIPVLGSDTLATPAFAEAADKARAPVQVLLPAEPQPRGGAADAAGAAGARARGGFEAWLETARRAGSADGTLMADRLRGARIDTPSLGEIRFDANGDLVGKDFVAASVRGGRWVPEN